jgi:DNA-binding NtrC family response regulator
MGQDQFRRDLYYMLADFVVNLPPLRHLRQDIPQLVDHFIKLYRSQFDRTHIRRMGNGALAWLWRCDWRANNVRELSVVLKRAVLLCNDAVLTPQHLWTATSLGESGTSAAITDERSWLESTLLETGGNLSAARRLSTKRSTLHDRLRRHGIHRVRGVS